MNPPGPFRWSDGPARYARRTVISKLRSGTTCNCMLHARADLFHPGGLLPPRATRASVKEPRRLIKLGLRLFVCMRFQVYCTPLPGFFSPFPHGTGSLSVDHEYLALEDGPPIFRQDYTCPALLVVPSVPLPTFRVRGFHPLWPPFPERSAKSKAKRYRLLPFRSPLLWESRLISVPAVTEMFQFSAFAPAAL